MKLSKNQLIGVGIASALVGIYFFAGDKIMSILKGDKDDTPDTTPVVPGATQTLLPPSTAGGGTPALAPVATLDITAKLRKGSKGTEV
jgi:hypothetical protein